MVEHVVCDQRVEACIGEGQLLRVDNLEGTAGAHNICASLRDHAGRQVGVRHMPTRGNARCILLPKPGRTATHVGNAGFTWQIGAEHVIEDPDVPGNACGREPFEQVHARAKIVRGLVLCVALGVGIAHGTQV
jgi:hypothetical protein